MVRRGTDQRLVNELASGGEYVVDPHAVAEAMLDRFSRRESEGSAVLVAGEPLDGSSAGIDEDGAAAGPSLA
jgi:hypothetical protein